MLKDKYHLLLYNYIKYAEETAQRPGINPRFLELANFIKKSFKEKTGLKHNAEEIDAIKALLDYLVQLRVEINRRPPPIDFAVHYTEKNLKVNFRRK